MNNNWDDPDFEGHTILGCQCGVAFHSPTGRTSEAKPPLQNVPDSPAHKLERMLAGQDDGDD